MVVLDDRFDLSSYIQALSVVLRDAKLAVRLGKAENPAH